MLVRSVVAVSGETLRARLAGLLERADVLVNAVATKEATAARLFRGGYDVVVIERSILRKPLLLAIRRLAGADDAPSVVVVGEREDAADRAELLAAGCDAVLYLGLPDAALSGALETIVRRRKETTEKIFAEGQPFRPCLSDFASNSPPMRALIEMARKVVNGDTTLLVLGETGVGKEWLTRAIHGEGDRRKAPFVAVNCAALPEQLLESELFGHEAGAFTGATRARRGAFEMAHHGAIFLDEIGEMPLHLQVKLLRVLQDHHIQRVGAETLTALDVRVMAASNQDLHQAVKQKRFRQDLFYRLSVVTMTVPPLRERREDIATIAESYVRHYARRINHRIEGLTPVAREALVAYDWPGNVRELINVIERAVLLCGDSRIGLEHLPAGVAQAAFLARAGDAVRASDGAVTLDLPRDWQSIPLSRLTRQVADELERVYLTSILAATGGNVGRASERASLNVRSLYSKMRRHGLRKEDFRAVASGSGGAA